MSVLATAQSIGDRRKLEIERRNAAWDKQIAETRELLRDMAAKGMTAVEMEQAARALHTMAPTGGRLIATIAFPAADGKIARVPLYSVTPNVLASEVWPSASRASKSTWPKLD